MAIAISHAIITKKKKKIQETQMFAYLFMTRVQAIPSVRFPLQTP